MGRVDEVVNKSGLVELIKRIEEEVNIGKEFVLKDVMRACVGTGGRERKMWSQEFLLTSAFVI